MANKFYLSLLFALLGVSLVFAQETENHDESKPEEEFEVDNRVGEINEQLFGEGSDLEPVKTAELLGELFSHYIELEDDEDDDLPDEELDARMRIFDLVPMFKINQDNCESDYFAYAKILKNEYSNNKSITNFLQHYNGQQLDLCKKENPAFVPVESLDELKELEDSA